MEIKILLAEDILFWRDMFVKRWNEDFKEQYGNSIIESESALKAINIIKKAKIDDNSFDIIVADIDFTEFKPSDNEQRENKLAGFEIIQTAKKLFPNTKIIWYSAQDDQSIERFNKEHEFFRRGYIDFLIKKSYFNEQFKDVLSKCLSAISVEKKCLLFPLYQLFGTYNYANNDNDGFYKITHSNFDHEEMKSIIPNIISVYQNLNINGYLEEESQDEISNYLSLVKERKPEMSEMDNFKNKFRFYISETNFDFLQRPLVRKNIRVINEIKTNNFDIYMEKNRISNGFTTIYENLASHNFENPDQDSYVKTIIRKIETNEENELNIEIHSNGKGFDPYIAFKNQGNGLCRILNSFKNYSKLIYESNGINYDVYRDLKTHSEINEGVKITLRFLLPKPIIKHNNSGIHDA